jgi:ADP-ribosyltransferase exoenzyme
MMSVKRRLLIFSVAPLSRQQIAAYTRKQLLKLSPETRQTIESYTQAIGNRRQSLNSKLINTAINQFKLPGAVVVYRGTTASIVGKYRVGKIYQRSKLTSTSLSRAIAEGHQQYGNAGMMEFYLPKGTPGLYIQALSQVAKPEHEILLPKQLKFKILDKQLISGVPYLRARVVQ